MKKDHAIVIGAGVAGAFAAATLAKHFKRVSVFERDETQAGRKGLPQAHHVHNVLFRGNQIIEELFPGFFGVAFDRAKAPHIEVSLDQRLLGPFGWNPRYPTGLTFRGYSRPFLDAQLHARLETIANLSFIRGFEAVCLLTTPDHTQVNGLKVRKCATNETVAFAADLVVDASGRSTRAPQWLEEIGLDRPRELRIKNLDTYATRIFRCTQDFGWKQLAVLRAPPIRERGLYALAVEQDKWIISCVGSEIDPPATRHAEFLAFARSLGCKAVDSLLAASEPIGDGRYYGKLESVCRFYDQVKDWPVGFVAFGDSVCTFNPIYGQGITTAAAGARLLEDHLKMATHSGWEAKFQSALIELLSGPWFYSVRDELRAPGANGFRRRFRLWAFREMMKAIPRDRALHFQFLRVQNLMAPLDSLFEPRWVLGALWNARFGTLENSTNLELENEISISKRAA